MATQKTSFTPEDIETLVRLMGERHLGVNPSALDSARRGVVTGATQDAKKDAIAELVMAGMLEGTVPASELKELALWVVSAVEAAPAPALTETQRLQIQYAVLSEAIGQLGENLSDDECETALAECSGVDVVALAQKVLDRMPKGAASGPRATRGNDVIGGIRSEVSSGGLSVAALADMMRAGVFGKATEKIGAVEQEWRAVRAEQGRGGLYAYGARRSEDDGSDTVFGSEGQWFSTDPAWNGLPLADESSPEGIPSHLTR